MDLNTRKTDKGQNLFIDVVGEKNAWQTEEQIFST